MKIGILGLGRAGKRHYNNAAALGHDVLFYDPLTVAKDVRQRVIDRADAIIIASPAEDHLRDVLDCLAKGKPILCEKPLGLTRQYEAFRNLIDLNSKAANPTPFYVGFNLRFHAAIRELKQCIVEFPKEPPYYLNLVCCQYTDQPAPLINGVCNDWLCHEVDLASWLVGPLRLLDHSRLDDSLNSFQANLRLVHWASGAQVHIHSDMRAKMPVRRGIVVADTWSLQYDLEKNPVTNDDYMSELAAFTLLLQDYEVKNGNTNVLATAEEALQTLYICNRADTSRLVHYDRTAS